MVNNAETQQVHRSNNNHMSAKIYLRCRDREL